MSYTASSQSVPSDWGIAYRNVGTVRDFCLTIVDISTLPDKSKYQNFIRQMMSRADEICLQDFSMTSGELKKLAETILPIGHKFVPYGTECQRSVKNLANFLLRVGESGDQVIKISP